jgi:phospholipid/cholesterol/gamma-HCH transport system substrate-binding protein
MEKPNDRGSNNFVVGLFVFVAFLVVAGFIVFMGGGSVFGGDFVVKTYFRDVRGLNIGAPVFLNGIQVGRVNGFEFPEQVDTEIGPGVVTVLSLFGTNRHRIKTDSEVTISTQGVLGDKVIVVTPGTDATKSVENGFVLRARQPKELSDYFSKGGDVVENVSAAIAQLNQLLASLNQDNRTGRLVDNLDRSAASLARLSQKLESGEGSLGAMIVGGEKDELAKSLASLRRILQKIDKGDGTLGALVNDASLHEDLRILLGGAQRSQAVRFLIRQAISNSENRDSK